MSVRSRPYANIKQITAHLTVRSILFPLHSSKLLVGDDEEQVGKLSQPGGAMNLLETNPFFAAIREALEELGYRLFFVLTNRVPQMHYTCFTSREPLDPATDPRHPGHPDYSGHPVTLRFNFEVLEISGNEPEQNDPHELHKPRYEFVDRSRENKRACFWLAMRDMEAFSFPKEIIPLTPDFPKMYELMTDKNGVLNIDPAEADRWTNHKGDLPYQEMQPFDEHLMQLAKVEKDSLISE